MNLVRFAYFTSIVFGAFALYATVCAIPNALNFPRDIGDDALRFGPILIAGLVGLGLLLPERSLPALRRIAAHTTPGPIRFLCAVAMVAVLLVAQLSGAFTVWVCLPIVAGVILVFIFPGYLYRDLSIIPSEEVTLRELAVTVGEEFRDGPKFRRYLFVILGLLISFGAPALMFYKYRVIPNPHWATFSLCLSVISGAAFAAFWITPFFRLLPKNAFARSLPSLVLMTGVTVIIWIWESHVFLIHMLPTGIAYVWGEKTTQHVTVVHSDPYYDVKGCRNSVEIRTARRKQTICSLSPEFVKTLSPGDTVIVAGHATILGQTIESLQLKN